MNHSDRAKPRSIEVDVGLCDTKLLSPEQALRCLSRAEQRRLRLICHPRRRDQFLASRWLLRQHVSHVSGDAPEAVSLVFRAGRAPQLEAGNMRLGLSHTDGLCLCVSTRGVAVGCDVEVHRARQRMQQLAARYFAPHEAQYLARLEGDRLAEAFYQLWTLKEATLKALGRGLSHGLQEPAFEWTQHFTCRAAPGVEPWQFAFSTLNKLGFVYRVAIAAQAAALEIKAFKFFMNDGVADSRPLDSSWTLA